MGVVLVLGCCHLYFLFLGSSVCHGKVEGGGGGGGGGGGATEPPEQGSGFQMSATRDVSDWAAACLETIARRCTRT